MACELSEHLMSEALQVLEDLSNNTDSEKTRGAQILMLTHLVALRAANRITWQNSRVAKVQTTEAKAEIDRMNLELQGLYYEQRHLKNEIKACRETPSIFNEVQMLPEAQYVMNHPGSEQTSARELMLTRLEHEKQERLQLDGARKDLVAKKAALIAENKKRKNDLESLEAQLRAFVDAAENIQSIFKKY